jgi:uncharacterized protein YcsI (UPF0317 family)
MWMNNKFVYQVGKEIKQTINLFFIDSLKTHASQPYVTAGLVILQYSFNFDFLETKLLLKKNWLA